MPTTAKHDAQPMRYVDSHYHGRSTQRGSSWTALYRCDICGYEGDYPIAFAKTAPTCAGGKRPSKRMRFAAEMES